MTKKQPFNEERWREQILRRTEVLIQRAKGKRSMAKQALVARNLLHLMDIKAAGHSPVQTELIVPSESWQ
jgi:hypothetical protein